MVRVFAGVVSDAEHRALCIEEGHGMCLNPATLRSLPRGMPLMFDTGGFPAAVAGVEWDPLPWKKALTERIPALVRTGKAPRPSVAIIPDKPVLHDEDATAGQASLLYSLKWLRIWGLPHGYPWFLAVQPGVAPPDVADLVHEFKGIAIGGTISYKLRTIRAWAGFCAQNGLALHVLRFGTEERLAIAEHVAQEFGIDLSVDSSNFAQNDSFDVIQAARARARRQTTLSTGEARE